MKIAMILVTIILLAGGYLWKTSPLNKGNNSKLQTNSSELPNQDQTVKPNEPSTRLTREQIKTFPKKFQDNSYLFIGEDRHFEKYTNLMRGYIALDEFEFEYKNQTQGSKNYLESSAKFINGSFDTFTETDIKNLQQWQSTQLFLFMDYREAFKSVGLCKNKYFFQKSSLELSKAGSLIRDLILARTATYVWQKKTERPAKINLVELQSMITKLTNCRSSLTDQIIGQDAYNTFLEVGVSLQKIKYLKEDEERNILEQMLSINDIKSQIQKSLVHEYYGLFQFLSWIEQNVSEGFSSEKEKSLLTHLKLSKGFLTSLIIDEMAAKSLFSKERTLKTVTEMIELTKNQFSNPKKYEEFAGEIKILADSANVDRWLEQKAEADSSGNQLGYFAIKAFADSISQIKTLYNELQEISARQLAFHLNAYQRKKGSYPLTLQELYSELPIDFQHVNPATNSEFNYSAKSKTISFRDFAGKKSKVAL